MRRLLLAFAVTLILVLVACGGAATQAPPTVDPGGNQPTPTADDSTPDPGGEPTEDPEGTPGSGSGGIGPIVGTTFTTGSAKIRLSGDVSLDKEIPMSGGTGIGGAASLVYGDTESGLIIGLAVDGDSGFALTGPITTGGGHNDGTCTIELTRNDSNALAGRIRCQSTGGIEGTTVHESIGVDIEFTAGN